MRAIPDEKHAFLKKWDGQDFDLIKVFSAFRER